jgi:predicted Zn-dependent protease
MRARVELFAVGDMAQRVIVHELGHALGLDHDRDRSSIMYPRQTESSDLQFIMLTQSDRQTLRELYCRR